MHIEVRDVWQLQRLPTQPTYFERATWQGKDGKGGRGGSSLCKEDTSALGKQSLPAKEKHLDRKDSPTFSLHAQSPFQAHRPAALWRQPWHFAYKQWEHEHRHQIHFPLPSPQWRAAQEGAHSIYPKLMAEVWAFATHSSSKQQCERQGNPMVLCLSSSKVTWVQVPCAWQTASSITGVAKVMKRV